MKRARLLVAITALVITGSTAAATAQSYTDFYASHKQLGSGQTYPDPNYHGRINYVGGGSTGQASTCIGIYQTSAFTTCGGSGEYLNSRYLGVSGRAAVHNHSTYTSYFNAKVSFS